MGELEPHQQRVVDEKLSLDEKLSKLDDFIAGPIFNGLPAAEQTRLSRQYLIMQLYEQVLEERIGAFTE